MDWAGILWIGNLCLVFDRSYTSRL